jgi:outer membrane putative beta-barrel porin/alpha-amylase
LAFRKNRWSLQSRFLTFLVLLAPPAWGAHPLITEDTGTQGLGRWQLEVNVERQKDGGTRATQWGTTLSYGFRDDADLQIGIPYTVNQGRQDLAIDVKWRFYQQGATSLGLKPGITLPTGDEQRGLGTGKVTAGSLLILSYEPEAWAFHTHAGYRHGRNAVGNREALLHYSAALWLKPTDKLKLVADLSFDTNPDRSSNDSLRQYVFGFIYSVTKDFDVDAGIRRGNSPAIDRALMAGITLRW